ncbi:MAG: elongation factor G [Planctomycetota bacterium]|jgi:elongation factor G
MAYSVEDIRNIVFVGHGDSGKTSLVEAMLHSAGATNRLGSVDNATSLSDATPEEKQRKISITASVLHFSHKGKEFNVLDTPGYPDFFGEVLSCLPAAETAVLVVSAASGVELNTIRTWRAAREAGLAGVVVVNKMDGENIDVPKVVSAVKETLGVSCAPLNLPIGQGETFEGVFDLFSGAEVPDGLVGDGAAAREEATESIVEGDDALLEKYLDEGSVDAGALEEALSKAVAAGSFVPILFSSARQDKGVVELMDFLAKVAPSPADEPRTAARGDEQVEVNADETGPFTAFAFKSMTDPYVGKLAFLRVYRGSLTGEGSLHNVRTDSKHRVGHVYRLQGREQKEIQKAIPGDLIAVAKIEEIEANDTLTGGAKEIRFPEVAFPKPMVSLAVRPKNRGDEQRISGALTKLADEDRTFVAQRDAQTGELVVSGMSTLHLDIMLERLKTRFDVEVATSEPKIPYKETITANSDTRYRHKKQTGGRGQYGEVFIKLEPLERGEGFDFVDEIVGGRIPGQYIPAVEKGIREIMTKGILAGCRVEDVRVRLYDGSFHAVDSSEAAFKMAASKAFTDGFMKAKPVLLEPVVNLEITITSEFMGDVSGDISSRRGRITGMDQGPGGLQIVKATAPMAEVMRYATELRSMTGGRGAFTMEFSHYDIVPQRIADTVIAQAKREATEEE